MSLTRKLILPSLALLTLATAPLAADTAVPAVVERLTSLYGKSALPSSLSAETQKDPLGHLVALQKLHWPQAWVTSTFYDWRTISKYRRRAGLHLGYDIAMPFGVPVSAGWGGVVTSVAPWSASEWGVTVTSPTGLNVTYGHISPTVKIGQAIAPGQQVGRIASDHVDVKMRDRQGQYIPFGEGGAVNAGGQFPTDRNALLTAWLVAKSSAEQAEDDLFYARNASQKWELERRSAERRVAALDRMLSQIKETDKEGLISRRRLEELKAERSTAKAQLQKVSARESVSVEQLRSNHQNSVAVLAGVSRWAESQGLRWADVEKLVQKTLDSDERLRKTAQAQELEATGSRITLEELKRRVQSGKRQLRELEDLYHAGGLSRADMEDRRLKQKLLEEEYQLRLQRK